MERGLEGSSKNPIWRWVKITLGLILLPLGVIGLFLPFLQGVLFLLASFALLSSEIPFVARFRDRVRKRFPGPWQKAEDLGARVKTFFGKGAER
jgi:uncharacterized membrane protein YbaN (DUF454 family)